MEKICQSWQASSTWIPVAMWPAPTSQSLQATSLRQRHPKRRVPWPGMNLTFKSLTGQTSSKADLPRSPTTGSSCATNFDTAMPTVACCLRHSRGADNLGKQFVDAVQRADTEGADRALLGLILLDPGRFLRALFAVSAENQRANEHAIDDDAEGGDTTTGNSSP